MKIVTTILSISLLAGTASANFEYKGSSFDDVWSEVTSNEYPLPSYEVSTSSLFKAGVDLISRAANRTLNTRDDLLEQMNDGYYPNKLAHPNGVCLAGTWEINKNNRYSGYFKQGSKALIVVRASTALSNTKVGGKRAFGFAGKLFPTTNASEITKTANFFTVDDLGGTKAKHFTDVELTNSPSISFPGFSFVKYALKLKNAFGDADQNAAERQMYEVSELGESDLSKVITPKLFKVSAQAGQTRNIKDFRNELNTENYNNNLVFDISVSQNEKDWQTIGTVTLNESIVSESCDRRLHFPHPKWRNNLKH